MKILNLAGRFIISAILMTSLLNSQLSAAELSVITANEVDVADSLTFTGTIEAVTAGTASAEISGRVVKTFVDVGDIVNKDDVILQLRDKKQRAALDSAVAGVEAARARFSSAKKEFARITDILKKGLVSQSTADNALSLRDSSKAELDAALARLKDAEERLDHTKVKAPYSGIVLQRHVEVGETVNPGTPLYDGMSLEYLRVLTDVPQKDIDKIRQYKKVTIELPNGEFVEVSDDELTFFGYADPTTSTFRIRVNLPTGLAGLYPGMYLKTTFKIGENTVLVIPDTSVIRRGEVTAAYVKRDDNLHFRHIRVGRLLDNADRVVLTGLVKGEKVISSPALAIESLHGERTGTDHE
ncbi:MAG: efflux RND transporter periplasmic adaptor subunit [Gammaproteobacteria bacterium]|nr:efflux RND transporter periplasmic adaptor subunit [Gammaproteobacteria bacterium]